MTEPTWREIKALTRLRRKQAATVYASPRAQAKARIAAYVPDNPTPGLMATDAIRWLWNMQCGRCYMCDRLFSDTRPATKEHVTPRAKGGVHRGNILLACISCNQRKGDRLPTKRERCMRAMIYAEGQTSLHVLMMQLDTEIPPD